MKFSFKNIFLMSFLATAGIFGVSSTLINKEVNDTPIVEKAEAATPSSYSKIYRFTAPADYWGDTVYVHAWGSSDSSKDTAWPGINISGEYSYNESSRKVYTFCTNVTDYQYLIFHNNSGWQTNNITIGSDTAWYLDSGNTPGTWTPTDQTYYFYDYKNIFGSDVKCYAWQSNGSLNNGDYPGVALTTVEYGSGQLWSISLDPAFDMFKIGIGDSANTGDQWINQHRGECFCWWDTGDSSWSNDLSWVKAHDWVYQTMHVRDISVDIQSDTGACRGTSGYYQKAKTAYNSFTSEIKTKIEQDDCYSITQTRLAAWAKANGESASLDNQTLTVGAIKDFTLFNLLPNNQDGDLLTIIIVVSSSAALLGITALSIVMIKRKKSKEQ